MGNVLDDVLTPAIGIALSPIPVIAVILMLLSARAATIAPAFAFGWIAGIVLVALLVMLLVPASAALGAGAGGVVVGVLVLALGLLLIGLAVRQWRSRPGPDDDPRLPKWMSDVDTMSTGQAVGIGAALAALNPKNLPLSFAAGLSLAHADDTASGVVGLVVFVLVASSTVLVPVVGYLAVRDRLADALASTKDWLARNNVAVMVVVFLVLGVALLGRGLRLLF